MDLNRTISLEIINELQPYVTFDINIINTDGLIIASTDKIRENQIHCGAVKLLQDQLSSLVIESDDIYPDCKRGVNLPIKFSDDVIGVIGITGNPDEAIKHARILQKMTEMLVLENFTSMQKNEQDLRYLLLITDLINGNCNAPSWPEEHITRAGLKADRHFTAAILRCDEEQKESSDGNHLIRKKRIQDHITGHFNGHRIICANINEYFVAITNLYVPQFSELLKSLSHSLLKSLGVQMTCAIGGTYNEYTDVSKSYSEAQRLLEHLPPDRVGVFQYDITLLELTLSQIPIIQMKRLFNQVFKTCTQDEIEDFCTFIMLYFNSNGALSDIAEKIYVHKNTVQYKIGKIAKKTTFDIRNSHDLFILYLAASYHRDHIA